MKHCPLTQEDRSQMLHNLWQHKTLDDQEHYRNEEGECRLWVGDPKRQEVKCPACKKQHS